MPKNILNWNLNTNFNDYFSWKYKKNIVFNPDIKIKVLYKRKNIKKNTWDRLDENFKLIPQNYSKIISNFLNHLNETPQKTLIKPKKRFVIKSLVQWIKSILFHELIKPEKNGLKYRTYKVNNRLNSRESIIFSSVTWDAYYMKVIEKLLKTKSLEKIDFVGYYQHKLLID